MKELQCISLTQQDNMINIDKPVGERAFSPHTVKTKAKLK